MMREKSQSCGHSGGKLIRVSGEYHNKRRLPGDQINNLLLKIDAVINLLLGTFLGLFPGPTITTLGLPSTESYFYVSILGAVLFGIGIALFVQVRNSGQGLGLSGAIAINMCGGLCLAVWLLFGSVSATGLGMAIMWALVLVLVGISAFEMLSARAAAT
jgi:hypothetical protein